MLVQDWTRRLDGWSNIWHTSAVDKAKREELKDDVGHLVCIKHPICINCGEKHTTSMTNVCLFELPRKTHRCSPANANSFLQTNPVPLHSICRRALDVLVFVTTGHCKLLLHMYVD